MHRWMKWPEAWLGKRFIPLRVKFMVSMTGTILLFGAINLYISYTFVLKTAEEEMRHKADLIAGVLQHQVAAMLQTSNLHLPSVSALIEAVKQRDPDILYILVFDPEGKIVAHAFSGNQVPPALFSVHNAGSPDRVQVGKSRVAIQQQTALLDGGRLGSLAVGVDDASALVKARKVGYAMTAMTLAFLILGLSGALLFSHFISEPIYKILQGFDAFVPGGPMPRIESPLNDELRLLARGFESMMERINETDRDYKNAHAKILETERLASMGTLATGMAHEINNPIAGIQMCVRRLQKSPRLEARQSEYLDLISEATNHIQGVVGDLLNYAQESEREEFPVDLQSVIHDAVKLVQPRLHRNNLRLHLDLPVELCMVSGVKSHLVQVIVNGVINAIDAIGRDGNIWISLGRSDGHYRIAVEDDGSGVSPEIAAKACEPFFTTKGKKGTGLGLYVSFGIVKAHHGSLELKARAGRRGSVLALTFPAESAV